MLDCASEFGEGATVRPITATEGYDVWAEYYDGPNDLIYLEESIIRPIIDRLPIGLALDAACGSGRHAAYLAAKGHSVIGVDGSAKMLAVSKAKVPGADFCQGDLRALPVVDQEVDLVMISLALTHVGCPSALGVDGEQVDRLRASRRWAAAPQSPGWPSRRPGCHGCRR